MGLLDALFGKKSQVAPGGAVQVPCILCGKLIRVRAGSRNNMFFYALAGKFYACCALGCDGKGRVDDTKLWSRIGAIPESQRAKSDVTSMS